LHQDAPWLESNEISAFGSSISDCNPGSGRAWLASMAEV
jgi:hypothetical protein